VWYHYVVVLYVPFAFARSRPLLMWAVVAYSFWSILLVLHTSVARAVFFVAVTVCVSVWATMAPRGVRDFGWIRGVRSGGSHVGLAGIASTSQLLRRDRH
jgi:hypothetical protein